MENLSFYLLNAEETLIVSSRINEIISESLNEDNFNQTVLPFIKSANSNLSEAIGRSTNQNFTVKLSDADDEQDEAFIGFRDYVKAYTNNPNKKKKAAAIKLLGIIKTIGWSLWNEGYVKESALLKSLFKELDKDENIQAINTINAMDWYEHLKVKHAAFDAIGQQKIAAEAEKDTPLVSQTKKEIAKYITPLLGYIEIMAEIQKGDYALVSAKLDEAIGSIMSIARSRQTRKENTSLEE